MAGRTDPKSDQRYLALERKAVLDVVQQALHPPCTELGARDLGFERDQSLSHFSRGRVHERRRFTANQLELNARRGIVVETFGEADVLNADAIADSTPDTFAVRGI